jgi:uncharacterized protein (DUF362 family)
MVGMNRRQWLTSVGMAAAGTCLPSAIVKAARGTRSARVAVARCSNYGEELLPTLDKMMDQLGGIARLVCGKTVAVKLNLTGGPNSRVGHTPLGSAQWVHPAVIGATVHLLAKAGARRIRLLESAFHSDDPLEEFMLQAGWEPMDFLNAAPVVEFENTNYLGKGKRYARLWVPGDGLFFKGFDLNHSYEDCDVFVSLAKLKEHAVAGVTLSMKNCFGITPCTIYGDGAGEEEPSLLPRGGRAPLHTGYREPSKSAPSPVQLSGSKKDGYRVPRIVVDLVAARPIHLAIIDGIHTMFGGEGPWIPGTGTVRPGVLVAGFDCVAADSVATAIMGFDPAAHPGTPPFEAGENTLRLAESQALGTCDLNRIDVIGKSIQEVRMNFRALKMRKSQHFGVPAGTV